VRVAARWLLLRPACGRFLRFYEFGFVGAFIGREQLSATVEISVLDVDVATAGEDTDTAVYAAVQHRVNTRLG
jgi:hypothetical protein